MTSHNLSIHQRYENFKKGLENKHPFYQVLSKIAVAVAGTVIIIVGIILIPLPGPGWLIVFSGLALLSLEFPLAAKIVNWIKQKALFIWNNTLGAKKFRAQQASQSTNQ